MPTATIPTEAHQPSLPSSEVFSPLVWAGPKFAASQQAIAYDQRGQHLLDALPAQAKLLQEGYLTLRNTTAEALVFSYAAEWLLDNFYIVQQTQRQVEDDLSPAFYHDLPKLTADTPLQNYPRVYELARQFLITETCQLDLESVHEFIWAYRAVTPLTTGELWALPIMLRLVLLGSLAQSVGRLANLEPEPLPPALQYNHTCSDTDVVANCIPSLRLLAAEDWRTFFERISHVEQILRHDPARVYKEMDFKTRDQYRKVIERLARATQQDEAVVAHTAVSLAQTAPTSPANHVGYYLLADGLPQLEQEIGYQPHGMGKWQRDMAPYAIPLYLGTLNGLAFLILLLLAGYAQWQGANGWLTMAALFCALIPALSIAVNSVNWLITHLVAPRALPKLDFLESGVPATARTMVVIPTLLTNSAEADSLLKQLELHYLRNPDPHLSFALLTDLADSDTEPTADSPLLAQTQAGIKSLNQRYPSQPFYFFHRASVWNARENKWMGSERKRGKLHEFNQLLRGHSDTTYIIQVGDLAILPHIRYIITLDADTILPHAGAKRLIGTLAHPLNHAQFDPNTNKVIAGYTILQPRTQIKPTSANRSFFTRLFSGDSGFDLYTLAVSDVYQDLFGEGSYVGKGIYDVDAFERSLAGRIPKNTLLSHDLFEGILGRAGLVSDIVLYEEYPSHFFTSVRRSQRWVRGDWQLLPWLMPWVPTAVSPPPRYIRNDLSPIGQWKIADNLRRSLLAPWLLLLFVAGWVLLPGSPLVWTLLGLFTAAIPLATTILSSLRRLFDGATWTELARPVRDAALRWVLFLAFLPYESALTMTAILTTLWRLLISRRNLLQWQTAASVELRHDNSGKSLAQQLVPSSLFGIVLALLVYWLNSTALPIALPLLFLWAIGPLIAYRISQPASSQVIPLQPDQQQKLRTLARRTWLFFEEFVGPDDNWLPPDHFQESPRGVIAHRTSPTNIGLYLLSALGAYDLGYLSPLSLTLSLRSTFNTLDKMERYRGHFLNWIDTRDLSALNPSYVSTVDSGNLAGCLLVLRQGCLSMPQHAAWRWATWQGLLDALALLDEALLTADQAAPPLHDHLGQMRKQVLAVQDQPEQWVALLHHLLATEQPILATHLMALVTADDIITPTQIHTWRIYADRIHTHLQGMVRELNSLLPWAFLFNQPPASLKQARLSTERQTEIQAAWQTLQATLPLTPRLDEIVTLCHEGQTALAHLQALLPTTDSEAHAWCAQLAAALLETRMLITPLLLSYTDLAQQCARFLTEMDFCFLFHAQREIFHIGYSLTNGRLDANFYDLLASESRIASLVAIAHDQVPQSHWLHLGRPLADLHEGLALLSWSGTMFEYLMPPLLMQNYEGTLLNQSYHHIVNHQIAYGQSHKVPWGISESGFYAFDTNQNYQYRAFGAPGLGFKRGLANDLVITPYASVLALPFAPQAVSQNLAHLTELGMMGRYGLFEALDFSPVRLELGQDAAIVRSYMAHHQGMILLSLVNYLEGEPMVARFHADPHIQSIELLLQEQIPIVLPDKRPSQPEDAPAGTGKAAVTFYPWGVPTDTPMPLVHFLSNGHLHTLLTNTGSGYSSWDETMLTRWRPDTTLDNWGQWLYVQDLESGAVWSAGMQPTAVSPESQELLFHPHMVEFRRYDQHIALQMSVVIAPEDDVEVRQINLTNDSGETRHLRLTSYAEVVLGSGAADARHPAFANLFVESEYLPELNGLLFRRRPRSAHEEPLYLLHMLVLEDPKGLDAPNDPTSGSKPLGSGYESNRANFVGRNRTPRQPAALVHGLSQSTGATLDPIMSLSQDLTLAPHTAVRLAFITIASPSRRQAVAWGGRYQQWLMLERTFVRARSLAEQELRRLELSTPQLEQIQRILSLLLYPHPVGRADADILASNTKGQTGLWAFGISGDYPILLVKLHREEDGELLLDLLRAHTYWRRRDLQIDLVILNQQESNYGQEVQGFIYHLIHRTHSESWLNRRGGLFVLREDQMGLADRILLQTTARVVLDGSGGTIGEQLGNFLAQPTPLPAFVATGDGGERDEGQKDGLPRPTDWQFDNGLGGFSADGKEYQIYLRPRESTPAPWINVIANEEVGFIVSETGGGFTWAVNSGENRLTSWRNDPVSDVPSEALYLRDEETAEIWSPTPQPAPADAPYLVRHGAGYTIFEHHSHGLQQQTRLFVAPESPVKMMQVRLENKSTRPRRLTLTLTLYAEWVLGTSRGTTQPYLIPSYEREQYALLARNPYNTEFGERVAFVAASKEPHSFTADRAEFIGRLGDLRQPAALGRIGLNNQVAAGTDSCAVLQVHFDLPPGGSEEVYFLLGQGANQEEALAVIEEFQQEGSCTAVWNDVQTLWDDLLGAVKVNTPDPAMNVMLNRWLLYQNVACRIWGRSALYQSSGAYGFRDQLQDVLSLFHTRPDLARAHILRAAHHQFDAGDVLHWWHPPSGRGVRTRISDDLLWLPYVTAAYVVSTGDETILAEEIPFLLGAPLAKGEEERYGAYETGSEQYSLFEHCRRALQKGSTTGQHGLPLMGGGDWNDGMNRIGIEGRGESVWLGWFLYKTLNDFADLCERVGADGADGYRQQAVAYQKAIEQHGWDGEGYRRAFDDEGVAWGSAQNQECQIDGLAQAWGVLSGAADPQRAQQAMASSYDRLVLEQERLVLLLTPPFDKTARDPGYIKGYLPGIRENGGQYTHAALWTAWAFAELGQGDVAHGLFALLNPISHGDTAVEVAQYKVEPYVLAADVYGVAPHVGRGGWTWYTGSAGWMWRLGVEGILGLRKVGETLRIEPCIPASWAGFEMRYRHGRATYHIVVKNSGDFQRVCLDGVPLPSPSIPLVDDGQVHKVVVGRIPQVGES